MEDFESWRARRNKMRLSDRWQAEVVEAPVGDRENPTPTPTFETPLYQDDPDPPSPRLERKELSSEKTVEKSEDSVINGNRHHINGNHISNGGDEEVEVNGHHKINGDHTNGNHLPTNGNLKPESEAIVFTKTTWTPPASFYASPFGKGVWPPGTDDSPALGGDGAPPSVRQTAYLKWIPRARLRPSFLKSEEVEKPRSESPPASEPPPLPINSPPHSLTSPLLSNLSSPPPVPVAAPRLLRYQEDTIPTRSVLQTVLEINGQEREEQIKDQEEPLPVAPFKNSKGVVAPSVTKTRSPFPAPTFTPNFQSPPPIKVQSNPLPPPAQRSQSQLEILQERYKDMEYMRSVVITANISSLIEQPNLIRAWVKAVTEEIVEQKPNFAAINIQGLSEKNGKNVDDDEEPFSVEKLFSRICNEKGIKDNFGAIRGFFDTDTSHDSTGLGSIFFIKDSITAEIFDTRNNSYQLVRDGTEMDENLSRSDAVIRGTFDNKRSESGPAEGYLIVKWRLFEKAMAVINLRLHDSWTENSKEAAEAAAMRRSDQIHFLISRIQEGEEEEARLWAGQFNGQLDTVKLVDDVRWHHRAQAKTGIDENNFPVIDFHTSDGKKVMSIGAERFDFCGTHDWFFGFSNGQMARKYNKELPNKDPLNTNALHEPMIFFPPTSSYTFDKKTEKDAFERRRCPAWSHRIFANTKAWDMMKYDSFASSGIYYGIIGRNRNIGAYKPLALHATLCVKKQKTMLT